MIKPIFILFVSTIIKQQPDAERPSSIRLTEKLDELLK